MKSHFLQVFVTLFVIDDLVSIRMGRSRQRSTYTRRFMGGNTWKAVLAGGVAGVVIYGAVDYMRRRRYRNHQRPTECINIQDKDANQTTYNHFICPRHHQSDAYIYCCGPSTRQKCCTYSKRYSKRNSVWKWLISVLFFAALVGGICFCIYRAKRKSTQEEHEDVPNQCMVGHPMGPGQPAMMVYPQHPGYAFGASMPPDPYGPAQPIMPGQIMPPVQYAPGQPYPSGQYPPGQPLSSGQYPPGQPFPSDQYPPGQPLPSGQYAPGQPLPSGQYAPGQPLPSGQYPPGQPLPSPGQHLSLAQQQNPTPIPSFNDPSQLRESSSTTYPPQSMTAQGQQGPPGYGQHPPPMGYVHKPPPYPPN